MIPAMIVHVSAGGVGIVSGAAALSFRKGGRPHRAFGSVFSISMLITAVFATYLAAVVPHHGGNIGGGVFTLYLVATAWMTVRRKEGTIGGFEICTFLVALAAAIAAAIYSVAATDNPALQPDGTPLFALYVFAAVAALAATLDLTVILRHGISGTQRIARHVWRMCVALFVGTGSFFIGQQKVMPAFTHGSPILLALGFAPLVLMVFWLFRVRFTNGFGRSAAAT
jgi:uncharacterized membrane protein